MTVCVVVLALVVLALLVDRARTQVATERERGALLQRIQAPERAVSEHSPKAEAPSPPPISAEDDAAFAEVRRRREEMSNGAA